MAEKGSPKEVKNRGDSKKKSSKITKYFEVSPQKEGASAENPRNEEKDSLSNRKQPLSNTEDTNTVILPSGLLTPENTPVKNRAPSEKQNDPSDTTEELSSSSVHLTPPKCPKSHVEDDVTRHAKVYGGDDKKDCGGVTKDGDGVTKDGGEDGDVKKDGSDVKKGVSEGRTVRNLCKVNGKNNSDLEKKAAKLGPEDEKKMVDEKKKPKGGRRGKNAKKKEKKEKQETRSPLPKRLTDYFTVRRSSRKCKSLIEAEENKRLEDAILMGKEEGVEVQDIPGKGRGVVSTRAFRRGEFVVEYHGERIDIETAKVRELEYARDPSVGCYMYYFEFKNQRHCIDATKESGRLGRLLNHSKAGNCCTKLISFKDKPYLILVAKRDITKGEELVYDYGDRNKETLQSHPWLAL